MTIEKALAILEQFEYSFDGDVKRWPDEFEYQDAMLFLRNVARSRGRDL